MEKKVASGVMLTLLLISLLTIPFSISLVRAQAYDVTIEAYCYTESAYVSARFKMDGTGRLYTTPHTFTSLTGTHTFTVRDTDPHPPGHPFLRWNTGETSTTITVSEGGTYTAYYYEPVHDVAVISVTASPTSVIQGQLVKITVVVKNEGKVSSESFSVTAYYDNRAIGSQTVTNLLPGASQTLNFDWYTDGVARGTYTIKAVASTVPEETDTADNTKIDGTVTVTRLPLGPFTIRIGVIGPQGWMQYNGMIRGAALAAAWINGPGGGIVIDGVSYDVSIHGADEHASDMRPDLARLEMERLITVEEVDVVYGGFRSEMVYPIREVAMDYNKLYTICGAATNELIDAGPADTTPNVRNDYDRYKYLFRATPTNATMLVYNILGFLRYYVLPYRLAPLYGSPINTCVISEDLDWTVVLHSTLSGGYLGPQANIVYAPRIPWDTANFTPYLDAMHAAEVRLVVQIFSAPASSAFISAMAAHPLKAVAAGIDVEGQGTTFWSLTGGTWDPPTPPATSSVKGGCEYEAFIATTGTRTPVSTLSQPYTTTEFWDRYFAAYGSAPIYTSWGVYDSIIALHDLLENDVPPGTVTPPFETDGVDADALIPYIELTSREGVVGRFKYTGPNPNMGVAHPANPNKIGTLHDVYSVEFFATWTQRWVRPLWVQWQAGRLEVVWPMDQPYSRMFALPRKMYPYPTDVNQDGAVDAADVYIEGYATESYAVSPYAFDPADGSYGKAHPYWQFLADANTPSTVPPAPGSGYIDGDDHSDVSWDMGKTVALPLVYCDEAGHLS